MVIIIAFDSRAVKVYRQYEITVDAAPTVTSWSTSASEYPSSTGRPGVASAPTSTSSPRRFARARKSASSAVQSSNQGEILTSTAAAPAAARTTKSPAIVITSNSTTCLSESVYAACKATKVQRNRIEARPRGTTRSTAATSNKDASKMA